jgi:uncharacterized protein YndB with AHSA1/START domain
MPKTFLQQHIFIDALPSKVWKVLTSCDYMNQYLLDGNVYCQWVEGSNISLTSDKDHTTQTINKGKVLKVIPGVLLKYDLDEEGGKPNTITYDLNPADNGIELNFRSEGFIDGEEDYFFRIKETRLLLQKIKWLAEYS